MDSLYDVLDYFLDKNIKMGIITNGESNFQNTKIDKLPIWLSNGKTWDEDTFFPRCIINSLAELILMLT